MCDLGTRELGAQLETLISAVLVRQSPHAPGAKARSGWGTRALLEAIGCASESDD